MSRNIDRSIDQAVRASQKEAQAAMRAAQREMEKIRPEMDKIRIKELENLKIEIDTKGIEKDIRKAMIVQGEAMARMRDAMWLPGLPSIVKQSKSFPVRGVPDVNIDAKDWT